MALDRLPLAFQEVVCGADLLKAEVFHRVNESAFLEQVSDRSQDLVATGLLAGLAQVQFISGQEAVVIAGDQRGQVVDRDREFGHDCAGCFVVGVDLVVVPGPAFVAEFPGWMNRGTGRENH